MNESITNLRVRKVGNTILPFGIHTDLLVNHMLFAPAMPYIINNNNIVTLNFCFLIFLVA